MDIVAISIIRNSKHQQATLQCDSDNLTITLILEDGYKKTYTGDDFYKCFGRLREDNPDIKFLCKGAKINVHPSSMSSQMTLGVKAYELTMGKNATRDDVVNIFDYEENDLTNSTAEQQLFYMSWIESDITKE